MSWRAFATTRRAFSTTCRLPVILDEIQNVPEVFNFVRTRIDRTPRRTGQWFLTGSQEAGLMRNVTESMAGRAAVLQLLPMSVRESAKVSLLRGGFPEVLARPSAASLWFSSYLQTYLERDVRSISAVQDLAAFRRFLALLASRHGQILNKSDLAAALGMSVPGIGRWLSILEATGQILVVPPWFENLGKRLIKSPKVYIADSGLACHLLGIETPAELEKSPFLGALFEGFVAAEIVKAQVNAGRRRELYYFRDQQGLEVDFVVPGSGGGMRLLEVKATRTPTPAMAAPDAATGRGAQETRPRAGRRRDAGRASPGPSGVALPRPRSFRRGVALAGVRDHQARLKRRLRPARLSPHKPEKHCHALYGPERSDRAHDITGKDCAQRFQRRCTMRKVRCATRTRRMNPSCPSSTPTLKLTRASGSCCRGRPALVSALAKPNPCSSPKANATTQGWRMVKLVSPAPGTHDLRSEEENAQRDRGIQRRPGHLRVPERRDGERDAVRDRERGHGLQQHPSVLDDQHQPEHEQQVIRPVEDVPDPLDDVGRHRFHPGLRAGHLDPRLSRTRDDGPGPAVEHLEAGQHVGDGELKPDELDVLSRQSIRPRVDPASFDERVRKLACDGLLQVPHTVRQLQDDRQAHARENRGAPQHAELAGGGLLELEVGGTRLVGEGRREREQQPAQQAREAPDDIPQAGHFGAPAVGAGACFASGGATPLASALPGGADSTTVYFARRSR